MAAQARVRPSWKKSTSRKRKKLVKQVQGILHKILRYAGPKTHPECWPATYKLANAALRLRRRFIITEYFKKCREEQAGEIG